MLTRLITTDTRIKYLLSNPMLFNLPHHPLGSALPWITPSANPALSIVVQRLAGPLNRLGLPQYIQLAFSSPVTPRRISLTFQGGFVGTTCVVATRSQDATGWQKLTQIYPEDVNRAQMFDLTAGDPVKGIKLIFEESSDFFGRITVYDLMIEGQIWGDEDMRN
ncbi:hypothetical protein DFH94DRAFT_692063 [Russula ochroleuca]|uniref:Uncharacterized protein n=1 Tax=Russula ochroleuca TaxID=152965 RepID=A0A9P5MX77_9AGAM|nr:hypothetical protein DFH94DRAFT_692063 [Russula ochroleuca]